jgi:hypothetical protein
MLLTLLKLLQMRKTMKTAILSYCLVAALSGPTAALADWTPPAWSYEPQEIASMPTVVLVMAGKTLPLRIMPHVLNLGPNAKWSAEFGIVNAQGIYMAPPYTPQNGEDTLTYKDKDPDDSRSGELSFVVHVLPNPKIPGSQFTPYIVAAPITSIDKDGTEQRLDDDSAIVFPKSVPLPPAKFLRSLAVINHGEKLSPPEKLTAIHRLPIVTIAGVRAYRLPVRDDVGAVVNAFYVPVASLDAPLRQAKELSRYPGTPYTNPDPRMPHLGKGGSRKWQTWRAPCP